MSGIYGVLNTAGLTNRDSEDFGSIIMGKRSEYEAWCDSDQCSTRRPVKKVVKGEPTDCPDCQSILIWKRSKKRLGIEIYAIQNKRKSKPSGDICTSIGISAQQSCHSGETQSLPPSETKNTLNGLDDSHVLSQASQVTR